MKWLAVIFFLVAGTWLIVHISERPIRHAPGILVNADPQMTPVSGMRPWRMKRYLITPRAQWSLDARVLSLHTYWFGRETELSPEDLALGWGPMSDQRVVDQLRISQSGRWWYYSYPNDPPIPQDQIGTWAGNEHIIPGNSVVRYELKEVRVGDVIHLDGYLVDVASPDGWQWNTALSQDSEGPHGCKLVWVQEIAIK